MIFSFSNIQQGRTYVNCPVSVWQQTLNPFFLDVLQPKLGNEVCKKKKENQEKRKEKNKSERGKEKRKRKTEKRQREKDKKRKRTDERNRKNRNCIFPYFLSFLFFFLFPVFLFFFLFDLFFLISFFQILSTILNFHVPHFQAIWPHIATFVFSSIFDTTSSFHESHFPRDITSQIIHFLSLITEKEKPLRWKHKEIISENKYFKKENFENQNFENSKSKTKIINLNYKEFALQLTHYIFHEYKNLSVNDFRMFFSQCRGPMRSGVVHERIKFFTRLSQWVWF